VINIASIDGIFVNPMETYSYPASKAAVIHLTRRMATKLIKEHINVTAIAPGAFKSDMNREARDHADEVARRIPARRIGTGGHGGRCDLPRLACRRLRRRQHDRGRWWCGVRQCGARDCGIM
jgi:NAD(P)-dependent dehydrogenase (short-subunit alcohol dehydrogenase family)